MEIFEHLLNKAHERYTHEVEQIALKVFKEHVMPILKKKRLTLIAGMGSWGVWKGDRLLYDHEVPVEVKKFGELLVFGYNLELGNWFPDYKGENNGHQNH